MGCMHQPTVTTFLSELKTFAPSSTTNASENVPPYCLRPQYPGKPLRPGVLHFLQNAHRMTKNNIAVEPYILTEKQKFSCYHQNLPLKATLFGTHPGNQDGQSGPKQKAPAAGPCLYSQCINVRARQPCPNGIRAPTRREAASHRPVATRPAWNGQPLAYRRQAPCAQKQPL